MLLESYWITKNATQNILPRRSPMKRYSLLGSGSSLILSMLLLLFVCSITAVSQQGTASVRGIVKDPQGNVIAGATVTLTNLGTTGARTTTTSESGAYSFDFIQVG